MDDIQFWIYLIFGAIYFLGRFLRKSPEKKRQTRPQSPLETGEKPRERPMTFEELLEQVTGQKELKPRKESQPTIEEKITSIEPEYAPEPMMPESRRESKSGKRAFADEESRRVYEDSIRMAEGHEINFERDEHFIKRLERNESQTKTNRIAADVRSMLRNADDAKKAIILGEILNRKY